MEEATTVSDWTPELIVGALTIPAVILIGVLQHLANRSAHSLILTNLITPVAQADAAWPDDAGGAATMAVALEARRLVELRDRWLNPPEWVEWVDEPVPGYPKLPVPRDQAAARALGSGR